MAVPVIEDFTQESNGATAQTDLVMTTIANVVAGELLLMMVGDDNNVGDSWNTPTGWVKKTSGGGGSGVGASLVVYWREGTETESANYTVTTTESTEKYGWMLRVSGVDATSDPFDVTGTVVDSGSAQTHTISEVTTTVAECLAFYLLAADGGDVDPFSVTSGGPAWAEVDEQSAGGGSSDAAGCFGTKDIATAGLTGDVTITFGGSADSCAILQFAIAPEGGAGGRIMSSLAYSGGLAGTGGIAGKMGGLAG